MVCRTIIVLSSATLQADGKFPDFQGNMYLGGQIRMEAATKIAQSCPSAELILAGGYNKFGSGSAQTSNQVNDMARYLKARAPKSNLKLVYALPCTYHNFVAVLNSWRIRHIDAQQVGILTNDYHMPRAMEFAQQARRMIDPSRAIRFIPMSAEKILDRSIESIVDDRVEEYDTRLQNEQRGLNQIRTGTYDDGCLGRNFEKLQFVITQQAEVLLTDSERLIIATPQPAVVQ